jgi:hypothetical protein
MQNIERSDSMVQSALAAHLARQEAKSLHLSREACAGAR